MRTFEELFKIKDEYKELRDCYDVPDLIKKLDKLNRSREIMYLNDKGIGTYDIKEAKVIKKDKYAVYVEGFYTVELGIRNITCIRVYINVCAELNEDGDVSIESFSEVGWE